MLLERGASLDAKTRNGDTALGKIFVSHFLYTVNLTRTLTTIKETEEEEKTENKINQSINHKILTCPFL